MKTRQGYVSNSSSSSFLIPNINGSCDRMRINTYAVPCVKLPEEIWKAIERNHVDWDGKKFEMSSVSNEWWLTTMVSDCLDCYSEVAGAPGALPYLEGQDSPYGYYDEDGEKNYIVFKRGGEKFYVDAYDFIGSGGIELPSMIELRDKANARFGSKMTKSQQLNALKCLFNF